MVGYGLTLFVRIFPCFFFVAPTHIFLSWCFTSSYDTALTWCICVCWPDPVVQSRENYASRNPGKQQRAIRYRQLSQFTNSALTFHKNAGFIRAYRVRSCHSQFCSQNAIDGRVVFHHVSFYCALSMLISTLDAVGMIAQLLCLC